MSVETGRLSASAVERMFGRIAPNYDRLNSLLSFRRHNLWRSQAVALLQLKPGDSALDVCCGTGDLAIADARAGGRVTGLDFSEEMLARARRKAPALEWIRGDLLELPFPDERFDAATVGFGVRNVEDLDRALGELRRVLRPGGRLAILEITRPQGVLAPFYRLWFDKGVPLIGKLLPGGDAYTYLPASVRRFPGPGELADLMRAAGFDEVRYRVFGAGIVALHAGVAR